ncbi:MAG: hypothetical protein AAGB12_06825 [Pseudomonadota bacterium]
MLFDIPHRKRHYQPFKKLSVLKASTQSNRQLNLCKKNEAAFNKILSNQDAQKLAAFKRKINKRWTMILFLLSQLNSGVNHKHTTPEPPIIIVEKIELHIKE